MFIKPMLFTKPLIGCAQVLGWRSEQEGYEDL